MLHILTYEIQKDKRCSYKLKTVAFVSHGLKLRGLKGLVSFVALPCNPDKYRVCNAHNFRFLPVSSQLKTFDNLVKSNKFPFWSSVLYFSIVDLLPCDTINMCKPF